MKSLYTQLMLSTVCAVDLSAFANSNAAAKLYVCATAQNSDLDQAGYEALTWVEVGSLGNHGETGKNTNVLTYDTWNTTVIQKAKGITDAGSPEIEVARVSDDAGQIILRAAGVVGNNNNYAFKMLRNDAVGSTAATILYNRGIVTGPRRPHGRNEDFDIEIFTLGLNQEEIAVYAGDGGTPPACTALPAISGTVEVGETLTLSNGTWTGDATIVYAYRWYAGGVLIDGATSSTYDLTASENGKIIQGRVFASNDAGSGVAFSDATAAVTTP